MITGVVIIIFSVFKLPALRIYQRARTRRISKSTKSGREGRWRELRGAGFGESKRATELGRDLDVGAIDLPRSGRSRRSGNEPIEFQKRKPPKNAVHLGGLRFGRSHFRRGGHGDRRRHRRCARVCLSISSRSCRRRYGRVLLFGFRFVSRILAPTWSLEIERPL